MITIRFSIVVFFSLLLYSCALKVPPGGGEKDILPPKVLSCNPPNYSINFKGNDIVLNFDEYIALNDLSSQLIVSPLLKNSPEVHIRMKSLIIHLSDTLLDNTTYTINFGQSIVDNHEGNKLDNFQYVFSTGNVIDSAYINGKIQFAFDLKTEKGLYALLYRTNTDSLPYLERPAYFARTNDSGEYSIKNISPGQYKIIGLKESDGNYMYTRGEEWLGFSESMVKENTSNINLKLFKEIPQLKFIKGYSEFSGKAVLAFNGPADSVKIKFITDTAKMQMHAINYSKEKDTISIWYENINADSLVLTFDNPAIKDTVVMRLFKGALESRGKKSLSLIVSPGDQQTGMQHLYLPYFLKSNHPLVRADFGKIVLLQDTQPVTPKIIFTDSMKMNISISYPWKGKSFYSVYIPSSIFKDYYGMYNDSTRYPFVAHNETDYGTVKIRFQTMVKDSYIIQLVDEPGTSVFASLSTESDTTYEFTNLDPRTYRIKFIHDRNKNGKWDTGDYLKHIQPEEVKFYADKITVRANWDVDLTINGSFS